MKEKPKSSKDDKLKAERAKERLRGEIQAIRKEKAKKYNAWRNEVQSTFFDKFAPREPVILKVPGRGQGVMLSLMANDKIATYLQMYADSNNTTQENALLHLFLYGVWSLESQCAL